ncbi:hypothetical protein A3SI_19066 [Nitritalea halalkaliphila LW7]|uniref:Uncharacterized protein n=1 Tax=Nitritalea halalkaliphila LW7 TaxID=1189621 RepID=I5BTL5_9BACT|nr:hypothetical protein [Nitritalea halalkaliphila]EIM72917.1 hypothetical protein A3SI_19066 [Nitritalea halalkaliphila LW7]
MQLKIEKWIVEQKLSAKITPLFDEAIKSYKASAYKASLLFSYLGFMTILKERIIKSQLPPGFPQKLWDKLKTDVQNTEVWDKKVFDSTQRIDPSKIYPISDTLRREVVYWKDRRNDCAHFKHEKIDYHHVESFWSFLETNLSKFTVNGGKASLLRKFKDHFDFTITPPDKEINSLIIEVESAVDVSELKLFFSDIESELDDILDHYHFKVYNEILGYYKNQIADELIEYIKYDDARLLDFIRKYPDKILCLNLDEVFIRDLWYTKLFSNTFDDFKVYTSLLQNNLIRPQDIEEANQKIVRRLTTQTPDTYSKTVLECNGFYDKLKDKIFPESGIPTYAAANQITQQIIHYIENFDLDESIVTAICKTFNRPYIPNVLQDKLRTYFRNRPGKKQEFNNVVNGISDLKIPDSLDFIRIEESRD